MERYFSVAFAGRGQQQMPEERLIHFAPNTSSKNHIKILQQERWASSYRAVEVYKGHKRTIKCVV
jgi:Fe-S cluster assembly scaffold protein SufB